ncbi:MAG: MGMT family protein [Chloroflexota bacterium]
MEPESLFDRFYGIVAQIPKGRVASYGQVAAMAGCPRGSRTVGWAMRAVPAGLDLPCHRVVYADGRLAPGFVEQRDLLESEGVTFTPDGRVDMKRCAW